MSTVLLESKSLQSAPTASCWGASVQPFSRPNKDTMSTRQKKETSVRVFILLSTQYIIQYVQKENIYLQIVAVVHISCTMFECNVNIMSLLLKCGDLM